MSSLFIAVIFLLFVIFLVILLSALSKKSIQKLTTSVTQDCECAEAQLRMILKKYPKSEIYISNIATDDECYEIIKKLSEDYPQIHVNKYPSV